MARTVRRRLIVVDVNAGPALAHAVANLGYGPEARLVRASALTGGASADVYLLHIDTTVGDSRRVVFRQHRAEFKGHGDSVAAKEHGVLEALHERGFAVPEPLLLHGGSEGVAPYLVMEWIDGEPTVDPSARRDALEQMAQFLVQLHSLPTDSLAIAGLDRLEDPAAALPAYLPPTETGDRLRTALRTADTAGDDVPVVLVHGDYWPGNVLWRAGRLAAVIDWEDASLGDPLADLACARVELLCRFGVDAMDHFTARYLAIGRAADRSVRLDSLALWELYVSAAALATMHLWGLSADDEAQRRTNTMRFFERAASDFLAQR